MSRIPSLTQARSVLSPGTPKRRSPASSQCPAAAENGLRRSAPPPPRPMALVRPILDPRSRLDPEPICSKPLDPDPRAQIETSRFGLDVLLKSPRSFAESTRRPELCKSIYRSVLFLAVDPLTFLELVPAVQPLPFCMLALVSNL